jgi:hypothetical protein
MDIEQLQKQFGRIGARLQITIIEVARFSRRRAGIDIGEDKSGQYFDLRVEPNDTVAYEVVDLQPKLRHLLLMARREDSLKEKYLCGHDERHWFVCAVPERRSLVNVVAAMEALQPAEVRAAIERAACRPKDRLSRHNAAFVRQGEWFFLPDPDVIVDEKLVYRNEPISRGRGSKPHMCQFLYRNGGEAVMVCSRHPSGVTPEQYRRIIQANPEAIKWNWRGMQRNATVYVRGQISHPDHKTIRLDEWHRVLMNTENEAPAHRHVVFLD